LTEGEWVTLLLIKTDACENTDFIIGSTYVILWSFNVPFKWV
jgi:hypothetical protein